MKTSLKLLILAGALGAGILTLPAADKTKLAGPKGGRLLEQTAPQAEFFVAQDRTVTITCYDAALQAVPVAAQSVTVIAATTTGKTTIEFAKQGAVLVSKTKLPDGAGYNLVVQFKQTADAKPQNFRFKLDLHTCGGCQRAEYACSCHE